MAVVVVEVVNIGILDSMFPSLIHKHVGIVLR